MQAQVNIQFNTNSPEVILSHNNETLSFTISVFSRPNFEKYDVFEQINQFWATLAPAVQQNIFNVYKDIAYIMEHVYHKDRVNDQLGDKIKELLAIHNLNILQDWIRYKSNIIIPSQLTEEFVYSIDNNTSREKTYTRADYVQLVTLSLCFRTLIPIWGEYIASVRKDTGTLWKEFYAFQLLQKSDILTSPVVEKLNEYIDHIVNDKKYNSDNILKGIASEDFSYWLLALLCIRRLCIGDIRGTDPKATLVTFIYKFIIQKVQNSDNNFENVVKDKKTDEKTSDNSENKTSTLERYKIKTNISPGEIVELEYKMRNIVDIANKLSCRINQDTLLNSLSTCQHLTHERILEPQMTLLRWVFKPVVSSKGLLYLPKPQIVNALGALETVLWARGHRYLALLATAYAVTSDKEMIISPVDSKMRVSKELNDELDRIYPYSKSSASKKTLEVKHTNAVSTAIDNITNSLMMYSWRSTASDELTSQVLGGNNKRIPIKPDIKTDLTKLIIELGSRSWL